MGEGGRLSSIVRIITSTIFTGRAVGSNFLFWKERHDNIFEKIIKDEIFLCWRYIRVQLGGEEWKGA